METEKQELKATDFTNPSELKDYKEKYEGLLAESEKDFQDPTILDFYILSKTFLREWDEFIGYQSGTPNFSKKPQDFNIDLLAKLKDVQDYRKLSTDIILKKGLQEKTDYEIINKKLMDFFANDFGGVIIQRKAALKGENKFVEVYLKDLNVLFLNHKLLMDIDKKYKNQFQIDKMQCSSQISIQELKSYILKVINKVGFTHENIRLWKLNVDEETFFKETQTLCNNTRGFDYQISIKATFIEEKTEVIIEDLGLAENDIIVCDVRENHENWNFVQEGVPSMKKCGFCSKFTQTMLYCSCKKVGYCTKECKFKDKRYHKRYCDSHEESDDEEEEINFTSSSRMGLTGLNNLGNTCFMNSALQCLSNTFSLTKYFLEKRYIPDINTQNILGSKGKIAKEYANLLINLWFNSSDTFSPYLIKSRVSDINHIFSGYNQHDSQEFLLYLLDGLHEDLNRIKVKPYLADLEFPPETSEYEMAKESWKNYQKRNLSIITDMLMGQYKSVITCPTCSKVSTTFDPFLTWSVPISSKSKKTKFLELKFVPYELSKIPNKLKLEIEPTITQIPQLKEKIAENLQIKKDSFCFYYISRSIDKIQEDKTTVKEMRKKVKRSSYYELYAIEKSPEELMIPPEDLIEFFVSFTHEEETSWSSSYKRTFFAKPFYLSQTETAEDLHLKIFHYLRYFLENANNQIELEEESPKKSLSDEEAYKVMNEDNACYTLLWCPNYRGFDPCDFCGKKYCHGCKIDYTKETIKDLIKKYKTNSYSSNCNIEVEVFWKPKKPFSTSLSKSMNNFQPINKKNGQTGGLELEENKDLDGIEETGLNLYNCLKLFEEPDQLDEDNKWYCNQCKDHKLAKKQMSVYKAPKYLIIHLKRFKTKVHSHRNFYGYGSHDKDNSLVRFPINNLNLANYVMNYEKMESYNDEVQNNSQKNDKQLIYDLYAVSNHSGGLGGGHYYAYAKNAIKNKWFCFNDSSVREMSESEVVTSGAYCLFYERRDLETEKKDLTFKILNIKKEKKNINETPKEKEEETKEEIGSATNNGEDITYKMAVAAEVNDKKSHYAS